MPWAVVSWWRLHPSFAKEGTGASPIRCCHAQFFMIIVIDNYDSFTYNLVQYLGELGEELRVFRNNRVTIEEIESLHPARIVISPGPGAPSAAGISEKVVQSFHKTIP